MPGRSLICDNRWVPPGEEVIDSPAGGGRRDGAWFPSVLWGLAVGAVLLGISLGHARLIRQPESVLLAYVPDDAFYYLEIARHLAAGEGSTFDGVNPTTGYHPGWMALLVPLARAVPEPVLLVRAALALSFVLHVATAFALVGRAAGQAVPNRLGTAW